MRRTITTLALAISVVCATTVQAKDHPLLSRYPDAKLTKSEQLSYERFRFPQALPDKQNPEPERLELVGDLSRYTYETKGVSTLKLYENYSAALQRGGFETLFSCETTACGERNAVKRMADPLAITGNVYNNHHNPYYLLARRQSEGGAIHVAVFIGGHGDAAAVQQVIIEERPRQDQLIQVDLAHLEQATNSSASVEVSAEERAQDHPLLSRYPGARLHKRERREYETFRLPAVGDASEALALVGDLTRHVYHLRNVSTLKLQENYHAALLGAGFEVLYGCELQACGDRNERKALGDPLSIDNNVYNNHHRPYYHVYRRESSQGEVHVATFIGSYGDEAAVHQVIVEERGSQSDLIQVDAEGLRQDLQETGKALIYGIYFDTNESAIKPESAPTLETIAELLTTHADLRLYIVGHTDDTGSEQHNLRLSSARADAVVKALASEHGIAANRLQSAGVGPYAPAAGNQTDAGRERNRRVELVERLR